MSKNNCFCLSTERSSVLSSVKSWFESKVENNKTYGVMDSMQGFDPCGMGSNPIRSAKLIRSVKAARKTLTLTV